VKIPSVESRSAAAPSLLAERASVGSEVRAAVEGLLIARRRQPARRGKGRDRIAQPKPDLIAGAQFGHSLARCNELLRMRGLRQGGRWGRNVRTSIRGRGPREGGRSQRLTSRGTLFDRSRIVRGSARVAARTNRETRVDRKQLARLLPARTAPGQPRIEAMPPRDERFDTLPCSPWTHLSRSASERGRECARNPWVPMQSESVPN